MWCFNAKSPKQHSWLDVVCLWIILRVATVRHGTGFFEKTALSNPDHITYRYKRFDWFVLSESSYDKEQSTQSNQPLVRVR